MYKMEKYINNNLLEVKDCLLMYIFKCITFNQSYHWSTNLMKKETLTQDHLKQVCACMLDKYWKFAWIDNKMVGNCIPLCFIWFALSISSICRICAFLLLHIRANKDPNGDSLKLSEPQLLSISCSTKKLNFRVHSFTHKRWWLGWETWWNFPRWSG